MLSAAFEIKTIFISAGNMQKNKPFGIASTTHINVKRTNSNFGRNFCARPNYRYQ